jgi:hypothetical protein
LLLLNNIPFVLIIAGQQWYWTNFWICSAVTLYAYYYFWGENNDVDANHDPNPTLDAV